jgi:hypothetical protein
VDNLHGCFIWLEIYDQPGQNSIFKAKYVSLSSKDF